MSREWIRSRDRFTQEYADGVKSFIDVASHHVNEKNETLCPCKKCQNASRLSIDLVYVHLLHYGMSVTYDRWVYHGEHMDVHTNAPNSLVEDPVIEPNNEIHDLLDDVFIEWMLRYSRT